LNTVRRRREVEDFRQRIGQRPTFRHPKAGLAVEGAAPFLFGHMPGVMRRQRDKARAGAGAVPAGKRNPHRFGRNPAGGRFHDQAPEHVDPALRQLPARERREARGVGEIIHQADAGHCCRGGFAHGLEDVERARVDVRAGMDMAVHRADEQIGSRPLHRVLSAARSWR
jgi:hypothetical protein